MALWLQAKVRERGLWLHARSGNHFQTFCRNCPHIDFTFVDFVTTPVILATLKIPI